MRKFKKVYIELTNICNLSCAFCPKSRRNPGFMEEGLFEKILNEVKTSAKYIYFHVLGEPLLHPKLRHFLELCEKQGLRVNITTNGTLVDKVEEVLLTSPALRQINVSLHSFEANMHNCSVDQYLNNIFKLIENARQTTSLSFTLRLWNLREESSSEGNNYILRRIEEFFKLPYRIQEELTPVNGLKLAERIFLNQAMTFQWPDTAETELEEKGFCYGLRDQIAFLVDGTVVPCCLDSEAGIDLGNIRETTLEEILASERASAMYDAFSNRKVVEPLCRKCSYRLRFNDSRF